MDSGWQKGAPCLLRGSLDFASQLEVYCTEQKFPDVSNVDEAKICTNNLVCS